MLLSNSMRYIALLLTVLLVGGLSLAQASPSLAAEVEESIVAEVPSKQAVKKFSVRYRTFIPMAKVSGPAAGCGTYGSKYKYGGDGRDFHASSGTSRTAMFMTVDLAKGITEARKNVRSTKVYNSSGKVVAEKTASDSGLKMRLKARTASWADLEMILDARNPFCSVGQISGSFIMNVKSNGSFAMLSGSHRQMPNHEVYVTRAGSTSWKTVYRAKYADVMCLASAAACPMKRFTGSGRF